MFSLGPRRGLRVGVEFYSEHFAQVIRARDAKPLGLISRTANTEDALLGVVPHRRVPAGDAGRLPGQLRGGLGVPGFARDTARSLPHTGRKESHDLISVRTLGVLLCLVLPAAAAAQKPIRLAAPGFTGVNVDDKVANFFSEHFAQRLSINGILVISSSEVEALVGLERQKQLMGCSEDSSSCLTELANALGADGIITGSVGKFGSIYQVNLKVLSATDAKPLAIISKKAYSEEDLLEVMDGAAEVTADDLKYKLRRSRGEGSSDADAPPEEAPRAEAREDDREAPPAREDALPAQARGPKENTVSINALGLVAGFLGVEYERRLGTHLTAFVTPAVFVPYLFDGLYGGFELQAGVRFYLSGTAPTGFALGLHALAGYGVSTNALFAGYRAEALYQVGVGDSVLIGLGASAGLSHYTNGPILFDIGARASVGLRF